MKIVITGSSSAIGKRLVTSCISAGHDVIEFAGSSSPDWKLGETFPGHIVGDALIHLAHDRKKSLRKHNEANLVLAHSFQGYKIFMSSFSAHRHTKSVYGRIKLTGEEIFISQNGAAIRAGIVFGKEVGGIYATLQKILDDAKIIPLPFRGNNKMFITNIDDLCKELISMAESKRTGVVFGANPWPMTFRGLVLTMAAVHGRKHKMKLISVPYFLSNLVLTTTKIFGSRIQILDSLRSLQIEASVAEISELSSPVTDFRKLTPDN